MRTDPNSSLVRNRIAKILAQFKSGTGTTYTNIAFQLGISRQSLTNYLSGKTLPSLQVLAKICEITGAQINVSNLVDAIDPKSSSFRQEILVEGVLRQSRARNQYICVQCKQIIHIGTLYFRDEPHPAARYHRGLSVKHFCQRCVGIEIGEDFFQASGDQRQIELPFGEHLIESTVAQRIDITPYIINQIIADPNEVFRIGPRELELVAMDRLKAMGLEVSRVGDTYQRDGGIDLIFWPRLGSAIPFLGAAQIKHHSNPDRKTGAPAIRDFVGTLNRQPFSMGLVITNTTFTADAQWVASNQQGLIRLRDMEDLRRWLLNNFTDDAEWREIPEQIELAPGFVIQIPR